MKKYSEMNKHEKAAYRAIKKEFNWLVGEWYNCYQDDECEYIPSLNEAKEAVYEEAMSNSPKEIRFAGEAFCREIVDNLFNTDEDAEELWEENGIYDTYHKENKEDKEMENKREMLNNMTVKELRAEAKAQGIEGMSRAKKEELIAALMNEAKPADGPNSIKVSKVTMYAFTGMVIGEFEAEDNGEYILVYTKSKGELMFDRKTGKEITKRNKARYANRVERA